MSTHPISVVVTMFHTLVAIISSWACIETLFGGPNLDTYCVLCSQSALWGGLAPSGSSRHSDGRGDFSEVATRDLRAKIRVSNKDSKCSTMGGFRYLALSQDKQDKGSGGGLGSPWTQHLFVRRTFGWTLVPWDGGLPLGLSGNGHVAGETAFFNIQKSPVHRKSLAPYSRTQLPGSFQRTHL